ncbi:transposase [Micromonospora sp. DT201]|uniref:transposase n=1 Tax=Micromonospora sp. DT201 TaxID=3393442 RepID=UPI003CE9CD37
MADISRFASRGHFASWNGTAPLDVSSGDRTGTDCRGPGTAASTAPCTSWLSSNCAATPRAAPSTGANSPPAKPRWKPCGRSNAACPTSSAGRWSTTPNTSRRAREDTWGRLCNPARPT